MPKRMPRPERLEHSDYSEEAKSALMSLEASIFQWNRSIVKGEMLVSLLTAQDVDIEVSHFNAMTAIMRIRHGIARPAPEQPTIGLVAQEMSIDPSRASRLATQLIAKGYVERGVAQEDGRKSVLLLTDKAEQVFRQVREMRWDRMLETLGDWSEEELTQFSELFARFVTGTLAVVAATPAEVQAEADEAAAPAQSKAG